MLHVYRLNQLSGKCAECNRAEVDHTDKAQCEACTYVGPCEILNGMLLCPSCYKHDVDLATIQSDVPANGKDLRIHQLQIKLEKEVPVDRRSYFVKRLTAIVDIEQELKDIDESNAREQLAVVVEQHLVNLRAVLKAKHEEIRELQGAAIADQKYLNQIVPLLRAEEREKFKEYDITYKPNAVVAPSAQPSKPRMSATDKAYESMAKMLGVTVEAYKASLVKSLANTTGSKCTCAETPGMCKLHPKG